jgi:hypothetical protein
LRCAQRPRRLVNGMVHALLLGVLHATAASAQEPGGAEMGAAALLDAVRSRAAQQSR